MIILVLEKVISQTMNFATNLLKSKFLSWSGKFSTQTLGSNICESEIDAFGSNTISDLVNRKVHSMNFTSQKVYVGDQKCNFVQLNMVVVPDAKTLSAILEMGWSGKFSEFLRLVLNKFSTFFNTF